MNSTVVTGAELSSQSAVLTIAEVARELRCSKAHVHNIVSGKVPDLPPLPVLRIGRRVLIRRDGLQSWMLSLEAHEIEAQMLTGCFGLKKPPEGG